ncbi:outer membrane protein assembly factor BamB family protein [Haloactinomyces albus]|uniref:Outer membrane protein assembly factor BamB n=1 Tax=Haloactinomyces albus TaxID=1352928 RepID=A0AAE3ZHC0_9ACTN|nr:PQQ-binding-like beta-propeller repeat protein [Haloactinomyces albus]MDR7303217.1 outer membrane protein assembly factor BamB [Haloactinomyces albus]
MQFNRAGAVPLPEAASAVEEHTRPVALQGTTAYLMTPEALLIVDTRTGRRLAAIRPQHPPQPAFHGVGQMVAAAPVITEVQGKTQALATFVVIVPGHGTTPEHRAVELVAVDTTTRTLAWRMTLPLSDDSSARQLSQVVGVQGTTAIVNVAPPANVSTPGTVHAVDLSTRTLRWTHENAHALALAGNQVVGVAPNRGRRQLTAWAVQDGRTRWRTMTITSREMQAQAAGSSLLAISGIDYETADPFFALVDPATGAQLDRRTGDGATAYCLFDQVEVLVCSRETLTKTRQVFAIDATTGKRLWQLPAHGQLAPRVTAVWHGAVYTTTDYNGSTVLDARTGKDRNARPGASPVIVNGVVGIVETQYGQLTAYPTSG